MMSGPSSQALREPASEAAETALMRSIAPLALGADLYADVDDLLLRDVPIFDDQVR